MRFGHPEKHFRKRSEEDCGGTQELAFLWRKACRKGESLPDDDCKHLQGGEVNPLLYLPDVMRQIQFPKSSVVETMIPRMWEGSEKAKRRTLEEWERMQRVMM